MGCPGRLPPGTREWNRAGRPLGGSATDCRVSGPQESGTGQGGQETCMAESRNAGQTKRREVQRQWEQGCVTWEEYRDEL